MSLALAIAAGIPGAVAGCGCPAALLTGELVALDGELVVDSNWGVNERVRWPFGYGVRLDDGEPVLANILGGVVARAGDRVRLGGGEVADGVWGVCGDFEIHAGEPSSAPTATRR